MKVLLRLWSPMVVTWPPGAIHGNAGPASSLIVHGGLRGLRGEASWSTKASAFDASVTDPIYSTSHGPCWPAGILLEWLGLYRIPDFGRQKEALDESIGDRQQRSHWL